MRQLWSFTGLAVCVSIALTAGSASAQCVTGGAGGSYPLAGAVTGTWDVSLPTGGYASSLAVTVPSGATVINSVKIFGLTHSWGGDTHIVLTAPSGSQYNLMVLSDSTSPTGGGCADTLGGDYVIVDPALVGSGPCAGVTVSTFACGPGSYPSGTYSQEFGTWTSGGAGVNNTALESIPIASGTWTLTCYDWYPPSDNGSFTSWDICFGLPTPPPGTPPPPPSMQCVAGGLGGSFPVGGSDGVWPTTLPTGQLDAPLAVTVPAGATKIVAVKLNGFLTTWIGDCHFVLEDPNGGRHNVFYRPGSVADSFGLDCDATGGDYVIIDGCYQGNLALACDPTGLTFLDGTYEQSFGDWPSGSAGINNTPLNSIPVMNGTYVLHAYDWFVGADDGSITSWELCFNTAGGPVAYCPPNAPGTTHGCLPTISATGNPNVAHSNSCVITVAGVEGQKSGIVFYGINGPNAVPWCAGGNSFLCVKAPTARTGASNSGGTVNGCDGALVLNWNAFQLANPTALGNPWSAGAKAQVQGWFRDPPACKTTFLSQALELTYIP